MAIPGGMGSQVGWAEEATVGTAVTVTQFLPFRSETITTERERIESPALRAGRFIQSSSNWSTGRTTVAGDTTFDLVNKGMGLLLKHMFGSVSTAQPSVGTDPTVYDHTYTPGTLTALGLTVQKGVSDVGGTARAFTYDGCKVTGFNFNAGVGELNTFGVSLNGEDESTATALATASFPSGLESLSFINASLTIGGTSQEVRTFSLTGDNGMATDRWALGAAVRKTALESGYRNYTGTVDLTYADLTQYNRFVNGTEATLVATLEGSIISNAYRYGLTITANCRYDGTTPTVGGPEEIRLSVPFKVIDNGTTSISVRYRTTGSTAATA